MPDVCSGMPFWGPCHWLTSDWLGRRASLWAEGANWPRVADSPCSYSYLEHHHHGGGCIKSMLCMLQGAGGRLLRCARVPTCC